MKEDFAISMLKDEYADRYLQETVYVYTILGHRYTQHVLSQVINVLFLK